MSTVQFSSQQKWQNDHHRHWEQLGTCHPNATYGCVRHGPRTKCRLKSGAAVRGLRIEGVLEVVPRRCSSCIHAEREHLILKGWLVTKERDKVRKTVLCLQSCWLNLIWLKPQRLKAPLMPALGHSSSKDDVWKGCSTKTIKLDQIGYKLCINDYPLLVIAVCVKVRSCHKQACASVHGIGGKHKSAPSVDSLLTSLKQFSHMDKKRSDQVTAGLVLVALSPHRGLVCLSDGSWPESRKVPESAEGWGCLIVARVTLAPWEALMLLFRMNRDEC